MDEESNHEFIQRADTVQISRAQAGIIAWFAAVIVSAGAAAVWIDHTSLIRLIEAHNHVAKRVDDLWAGGKSYNTEDADRDKETHRLVHADEATHRAMLGARINDCRNRQHQHDLARTHAGAELLIEGMREDIEDCKDALNWK